MPMINCTNFAGYSDYSCAQIKLGKKGNAGYAVGQRSPPASAVCGRFGRAAVAAGPGRRTGCGPQGGAGAAGKVGEAQRGAGTKAEPAPGPIAGRRRGGGSSRRGTRPGAETRAGCPQGRRAEEKGRGGTQEEGRRGARLRG